MTPGHMASELGDLLHRSTDVLGRRGIHQRNPGVAQDDKLLSTELSSHKKLRITRSETFCGPYFGGFGWGSSIAWCYDTPRVGFGLHFPSQQHCSNRKHQKLRNTIAGSLSGGRRPRPPGLWSAGAWSRRRVGPDLWLGRVRLPSFQWGYRVDVRTQVGIQVDIQTLNWAVSPLILAWCSCGSFEFHKGWFARWFLRFVLEFQILRPLLVWVFYIIAPTDMHGKLRIVLDPGDPETISNYAIKPSTFCQALVGSSHL